MNKEMEREGRRGGGGGREGGEPSKLTSNVTLVARVLSLSPSRKEPGYGLSRDY